MVARHVHVCKPARNETPTGVDNMTRDRYSYRDYTVRSNPLNGTMWIEQSGAFVGYVADDEGARQVIDYLTDKEQTT